MRDKRNNVVYLHHISDAIRKLLEYRKGHELSEFLNETWDQDAVSRNLEIIGEATNNIDEEFRQKYPEVPWRNMKDLRNLIAHDYVDIDPHIIWNVMTSYLPNLAVEMNKILEREETAEKQDS